tara:strand:+ start:1843 stop:1956 length:114 start_codon:yes stop_codon:yes gene_type:complete
MFDFIEVEKMFSDPMDEVIFVLNKYLLKVKFIKTIFS